MQFDNGHGLHTYGGMRRFQSLLALALALVWVPVAMCCEMAAAGWEITCCDASCDDEGPATAHVACDSPAQDGHVESLVQALKLAPAMALLDGWHDRPAAAVMKAGAEPPCVGRESRPLAWVNTWQFERRAAAPAQAPDPLLV